MRPELQDDPQLRAMAVDGFMRMLADAGTERTPDAVPGVEFYLEDSLTTR